MIPAEMAIAITNMHIIHMETIINHATWMRCGVTKQSKYGWTSSFCWDSSIWDIADTHPPSIHYITLTRDVRC